MENKFHIVNCQLKGCHHNRKSICRLDTLPIMGFADSMQFFRDSKTCQVRHQISIHRTEQLIGKD